MVTVAVTKNSANFAGECRIPFSIFPERDLRRINQMIDKYGIVRITEEEVEVTNFVFDSVGLLTMDDFHQEAIRWAIERLQSKLDSD